VAKSEAGHSGFDMRAGWKVDLDVLGTNNTFQKQVRHVAISLAQADRHILHPLTEARL
jgi:hypothetical protein